MLKYNELFWGDSNIEKITIEYDKIIISIFNDVLQKEVYIECSKCIGMTNIYTWDETIIENILLDSIISEEHPMWGKIYELYGEEAYDSEKNLMHTFYEVKIVLINKLTFSVICQEVKFREG